jgi:hypothetical protein
MRSHEERNGTSHEYLLKWQLHDRTANSLHTWSAVEVVPGLNVPARTFATRETLVWTLPAVAPHAGLSITADWDASFGGNWA